MDRVVILVRSCELLAIVEQPAETVRCAQLKLRVHLDGFEGANFNADLAAHAHRDVDIESCWINLQLARIVRLLVLALFDVDAFRRTFLLADLASYAAHACLPI